MEYDKAVGAVIGWNIANEFKMVKIQGRSRLYAISNRVPL